MVIILNPTVIIQDEYLFDPNILQSLFKGYYLKDSKLQANIYDGQIPSPSIKNLRL